MTYVLLTAARNEEEFIEKTIQSVVAQTILPQKWIIVSDGSTDRTDDIVQHYMAEHDFIELLRRSQDPTRNFGSKAKAITAGYDRVRDLEFDYVGNLDADVSFDVTYYAEVMVRLEQNPKLGIAGGIRYDLCGGRFKRLNPSRNSVGGPFQMFRRECFEAVGGYQVLKYGGVDAVAEISARMHGWETEMFPELSVYHHRCTGTADNKSDLYISYRAGIRDYVIGYHPLFQFLRGLARLPHTDGLVRFGGFVWAAIKGIDKAVSDEFVRYLRNEQLGRLRRRQPNR